MANMSAFTRGKLLASLVYPEFFAVDASERLLDLGCGTGPQIALYAPRARQIVGIDVQPNRLEQARRLIGAARLDNAVVLLGDVGRLPIGDGAMHAAIAIDIIEHLDDPDAFLREARRVLAPGGRLLVTVPAFYDRLQAGPLGAIVARLKGRPRRFVGKLGYDDHRPPRSLAAWEADFLRAGFVIARSRATTLFPPLHRYGVPRFWFAVAPLRRALSALGSLPGLRGFGQAVMYELRSS